MYPFVDDKKTKKPITQRWWFWVVVALLAVSMLKSCGGEDANAEPETPKQDNISVEETKQPEMQEEATEPEPEPEPEPKPEPEPEPEEEPIILIAGEEGEYGELYTVNKDTEFEETYYVYIVPAGTYTVTNTGEYMAQFSVYSYELVVNSSGWEEPAEIFFASPLDVGASETVTIEDGQIIEIHEPANFTLVAE